MSLLSLQNVPYTNNSRSTCERLLFLPKIMQRLVSKGFLNSYSSKFERSWACCLMNISGVAIENDLSLTRAKFLPSVDW